MSNVNELSSIIMKLVIAVIVILLSKFLKPLIDKAFAYISTKIENLNNEKAQKAFDYAVKFLTELVATVVQYLEQEYGSEIRKGIADGTNNREELFKLKDIAIGIIKSQLNENITNILKSNIENLDDYIDNLVSEQVLKVKDWYNINN